MSPRDPSPISPPTPSGSTGSTSEPAEDEFVAMASRLAEDHETGAVLVIIDRGGGRRTEDLTASDPVGALLNRLAPPDTGAVGLVATASVRPFEPVGAPEAAAVAHLVDRNGRAVTVVATPAGPLRVFGPHLHPQIGRVPDACRRMLGLPTAPPDRSMTGFVLGAWLETVVRRALTRPGLDWPAVAALHPAAAVAGVRTPCVDGSDSDPDTTIPTPALIASHTRQLGELLDWERFRMVVSRVGGFPFGENACRLASWMDAGMFSRWATDEIPDRTATLDMLDAVLQPSAFDRVWATIRLCEEDPGPTV